MSLSVSASTLITQLMKSDANKSGTIDKAEFQSWAAGKSGDVTEAELQGFFAPKLDLASFLQSQSANNADGPSILDSLSTNSGSASSPSVFDSLSGSTTNSTDTTAATLNKMLQAYIDKQQAAAERVSTSA